MELVYQGSVGRRLYRHDCQLLGLSMTTEEEVLLELATRAGKSTAKALASALNVKKGLQKIDNTHGAEKLKKEVLEKAKRSNKLTAAELSVLREGVRDSVNTGYGNSHEEEALNMYEKQCGWEVNDRNEHVMAWPFVKAEDLEDTGNTLTVVPLSQASPYLRQSDRSTTNLKDGSDLAGDKIAQWKENIEVTKREHKRIKVGKKRDNDTVDLETNKEDSKGTTRVDQGPVPLFIILGSVDGIRQEPWFAPSSNEQSPGGESLTLRQIVVECKHRMKAAMIPPPLYDQIQAMAYCLMYNVDGADIVQVVRKRLDPPTRKELDDRRKQKGDATGSKPSTPDRRGNSQSGIVKYFSPKSQPKSETAPDVLHEETACSEEEQGIRANLDRLDSTRRTSKETDGTDLVGTEHCASTSTCTNLGHSPRILESSTSKAVSQTDSLQVSETVSDEGDEKDSREANDDERKEQLVDVLNDGKDQAAKRQKSAAIDIFVSRVSLDEPVMQHRRNWNNVVLPRLRSFAEAVYAIRKSDEKRYQLLTAMSDGSKGNENELLAWTILHQECPWLVDCDTAFHRL